MVIAVFKTGFLTLVSVR